MKIWRELLGYVKLIVIVVAITLIINNVVLINAKIPSPSSYNQVFFIENSRFSSLSYLSEQAAAMSISMYQVLK